MAADAAHELELAVELGIGRRDERETSGKAESEHAHLGRYRNAGLLTQPETRPFDDDNALLRYRVLGQVAELWRQHDSTGARERSRERHQTRFVDSPVVNAVREHEPGQTATVARCVEPRADGAAAGLNDDVLLRELLHRDRSAVGPVCRRELPQQLRGPDAATQGAPGRNERQRDGMLRVADRPGSFVLYTA